jgi:hypothetical protein
MTIIYKVAAGFNNIGGLVALNPQPACEGIQWPERNYSVLGKAKSKGKPFTKLEYSQITNDEFENLLDQIGVDALIDSLVESSEVTLQIITNLRAAFTCNAIVDLPEQAKSAKWRMGFYRDVVFEVRHIEVIP